MFRQIQKGFTLIELMIVIAIIAILAAVVLPKYRDYKISTKVTEGITMADGIKKALTESFQSNGPGNNGRTMACSDIASCGNIGASFPSATQNVASVVSDTQGNITVTYTSAVVPAGSNTLVISPTYDLSKAANAGNQISWVCGSGANGGTTVLQKYLPSSCRGQTGATVDQ